MSHAQDVLFASLTDVDALDVLAQEGLPEEVIPTEAVRPVVAWCLDRYFESGRKKAPSAEAINEVWGQLLEDEEISLGDGTETDNIEWAIDQLKSQYVYGEFQTFLKSAGRRMHDSEAPDRVITLAEIVNELFSLSLAMQSKIDHSDARTGIVDRLIDYEARALAGMTSHGLLMGLDQIDSHTFGIHPGELAVLAAGPKIGKSYWLAKVALEEWRRGKIVTLFSLENGVPMTLDRLIMLATGTDSTRWQRGLAHPEEVERAREFARQIEASSNPLHVIKAEPGSRTAQAIVRKAQILGSESLLIDQLTFMEHADPGRKARWEVIRDMTHDLKSMISTGRDQLPCLLAHQISREGVKAAQKSGCLEMFHLAEGSETERTADWVFGLFQSGDDRAGNEALFQVLAARRADIKMWQLAFQLDVGYVSVLREVEAV